MKLSRREFIAASSFALPALPLAAHGQDASRLRRVGVLISGKEADKNTQHRFAVFKDAMRQLSWTEGKNVRYDVRWGSGNRDRIWVGASELLGLAPDAVLTVGTPATGVMHRVSKNIPIVFAIVSDPVGDGFVKSLAHPGGNVTGFITYYPEFVGKWLEMLKEAAPQVTRAGLLFNPRTAPFSKNQYLRPFFERAARDLAVDPIMLPVRTKAEIEVSIDSVAHKSGSSLIVMPDSFMLANRATIIERVAKNRVPVIYPFSPFAFSGGLMAYGVDMADLTRRAATYVDRVLRNEKPASLPVQAPTKFEFIVNLKTAKALGIAIPQSILLRATEVIE
jgi:putative ABC transport system substrate-binding protein